MKAVVYGDLQHQKNPCKNFGIGLEKHGIDVTYIGRYDLKNTNFDNFDIAVVWAYRTGFFNMKKLGIKNVIILENSHLNNIQKPIKEWISAGWNGLNGRADFCNKNSPSDRWEKYFNDGRLLDYTDGEYVFIPLQIKSDMSLYHVSKNITYQKICEEIRNFTDLPIKIKEHPTLLSSWPKVIGVKDVSYLPRMMPIGDAVKNAKVVVAINSNSCVDSLIAGKPVINLDEGSMTWDIAERDFTRINLPPWPDRSQWCNNMAYCNWNPEDLRKGEAWEVLKKKL